MASRDYFKQEEASPRKGALYTRSAQHRTADSAQKKPMSACGQKAAAASQTQCQMDDMHQTCSPRLEDASCSGRKKAPKDSSQPHGKYHDIWHLSTCLTEGRFSPSPSPVPQHEDMLFQVVLQCSTQASSPVPDLTALLILISSRLSPMW